MNNDYRTAALELIDFPVDELLDRIETYAIHDPNPELAFDRIIAELIDLRPELAADLDY